MTQAIATLALLALMFLNSLGNFWFTYGIWPKSWASFAFFFVSGMVLYGLLGKVGKDR